MPDRIHAAIHAVETAATDPDPNLAGRQSDSKQLPARDDSVLPLSEFRNRQIRRHRRVIAHFGVYDAPN
jgi:hypothetical protein